MLYHAATYKFVMYHFTSERGLESLSQWVLHFFLYHS
ncbi:hypothetical protein PITC_088070 [Penicillium italicum]|uniref:Uncharacterized protein n=1 Tax=Penicillium italicum TaxID=40296 RepID=A0A0A2LBF1_PENIT|nr:hypothetical protein PITC_088070 [Penicillium italicum]